MAILGYNTAGASQRGLDLRCRGLRVTMPVTPAAGSSIFAYLSDTGAGDGFRAYIVDTDGLTVLAQSDIRTDISTATWYEFTGGTLISYVPTASQILMIVVASNSAADSFAYFNDAGLDGVSETGGISSIDPLTIDPDFPIETDAARDYSIYLNYTAAPPAVYSDFNFRRRSLRPAIFAPGHAR